MPGRIKVIFFDLGETLVTQNIEDNMVTKRALQQIARLPPNPLDPDQLFELYQRGYRVNHALRSEHLVEIPVQTWMSQLLRAALGREPSEALVKRAIKIIVQTRAANAVAFKDTKPTLAALSKSGRKLGIISNVSSHEVAIEILRNVGLKRYFDKVITSAQTGIRKPDPGIFLYALMQLGAESSQAIHVGDSEIHDVRGAKTVGMGTVLVSRRRPPSQTEADYHFRNLADARETLQTR